jgi:hypothetical protein
VFREYGPVAGFSRPMLLSKHIPSAYAFIKYSSASHAQDAIAAMNFCWIWDVEITAAEADEHHSFFSSDTGGLINHEAPFHDREADEFDNSLPSNHYEMKRKEALKGVDRVYSIRVDDIHPEIT